MGYSKFGRLGWILSGLVLGSLAIAPPSPALRPALSSALSTPIAGSPATERTFQRGLEAYESSDYRGAIAAWEEALRGFRTDGDSEGEADVLSNLGVAHSALGEYRRAIEYYEQSLELARDRGDRGGEASPLGNLGNAYYSLGDYPKAIAFHQQALTVAREVGNRRSEARSLGNLATVYFGQGDFRRALEVGLEGLALHRATGNQRGIAAALGNVGQTHFALGNYRRAIALQREALTQRRELGDFRGGAQSLSQLGQAYFALGEYAQSRRAQEQALEIRQSIGDRRGEATSLRNLGAVDRRQGFYRRAIGRQRRALEISRALGDRRGEAGALDALGRLHRILGQFDQAIEFHSQALALDRELGDRQGESSALTNLGNAHFKQGDADQALTFYQQSLALDRETGDRRGERASLGNIANVQIRQGRFAEAIAVNQQALDIAQELEDLPGQATALTNFGVIYSAQEDHERAIATHERALELARTIKDPALEAAVLHNLGQALERAGRLGGAEKVFRRAIAVQDRRRSALGNSDAEKISIFEEQSKTYRALQRVLIATDQPEAALEIADHSRSRSLVDAMIGKSLGTTKPLGIAAIKSLAEEQQATILLYSNLSDTQLAAWTVSPDGTVTLHPINPEALGLAIADTTTQARQDATNPLGEAMALWANEVRSDASVEGAVQRPGQTLGSGLQDAYQLLIAPVESTLPTVPNAKLIIIPDRELGLVPFSALQDSDGRSLIERFALFSAPSLQTLQQLEQRQREGNPAAAPLIIGNPDPMPEGLAALPGAEREAIAIAQLRNVEPILGAAATEGTVKEKLPNAPWLHFATHGVFNDGGGNDLSSWLALAPGAGSEGEDGQLSMGEIFEMQLQAETVVLSACDTGKGRVTGEGVIGLGRAFLKAGSSTVIATLWKVPDDATALLMTTFYQELAAGKGKAEALQAAVIATKAQYPHPRNWAAFVLIGAS
ncbi:MAG: tetratricopeptide repeat protein [Cyanobacteria bacterium P01_C01_bin.89]